MSVTLYVVPGSHPCTAVEGMLAWKGIGYRRVDLIHVVHKAVVRLRGFPGATVPALDLDGRKVLGSRAIARALDEAVPEPRLLPADAGARAAIEEAEAWGDQVLQPVPRRLSWWILRRDSTHARSFLTEARLPIPVGMAIHGLPLAAAVAARLNGATDEAVRADLAALPETVGKVERYIDAGVLGGPTLNAADFQIGASVRLLSCFDDLRPWLEGRRALAHARRVVPQEVGRMGRVLPREWLPPAIEAAAAATAPVRP